MTFLSKRKGFTLIELMVVIAIIGILASIITVSLQSSRAKGRDAKRVSDIRTIQLSVEEYYNDNGYYPVALSSISPTYLSTIPKDPKDNSTNYFYSSYNSAVVGSNCLGKATSYHLAAAMESDDTSNPALKQDVDNSSDDALTACAGSTASFDGKSASCANTTAQLTDNCYDQTN